MICWLILRDMGIFVGGGVLASPEVAEVDLDMPLERGEEDVVEPESDMLRDERLGMGIRVGGGPSAMLLQTFDGASERGGKRKQNIGLDLCGGGLWTRHGITY